MKIMVFDVPAESGGGLSILTDFYNEFKTDSDNDYIFVISKPILEETKNIKVMRFPWIKKSWFHRLFFDYFVAPQLVKKNNIDKIFSLQNVTVPLTKVPQTVYIHNALPFSEKRFKLSEDKLLWLYQNIISKKVFKSVYKSEYVIVQTQWMKKELESKLNVDVEKIMVLPPKVNVEVKNVFEKTNASLSTFFYPASGILFKNHKLLVEACILLQQQNIHDYRVVFTLNGDENKHILDLYNTVLNQNLPIDFIGNISRESVFEYYSKSVLIFPSYIETVGLPLLEASLHKTPILTSDSYFSHEILEGNKDVKYFNYRDKQNLSDLMKAILKSRKVKKNEI